MKKLFLLLGFLLAVWLRGNAAYIERFPVTVTQPDSTVINCFVSGDEFYNWVHDSNGYTLIRDPQTGFVVYADLQNDSLISTGYAVGSIDPATIGLLPYINISAEKRTRLRSDFLNNMPRPVNARGGSPAISNAGQNNGTLNNIVIYIRFADDTADFAPKANLYDSMFNDTSGNGVSMYRYFKEASYGKTLISTTFYPNHSGNVIVSYQDAQLRSYYQPYDVTTNPNGYMGGDNGNDRRIREHDLLRNAILAVRNQIPSNLNLDYNNDGEVDNICFIVKGGVGAWNSLLWAHKWALYSYNVTINNKLVYWYNMQIENHMDAQGASVLSHEMFHTLGAPDLYRYNSSNFDPVGNWDLMASNIIPRPQSMSAYMKYKYGGWIDSLPTIRQSGTYTLHDVWSDTNNIYKIPSPNSASEFFVVEYRRTNTFWDAGLSGSGLLIYRINSLRNGNEYPPDEVYVFRLNGNNTSTNGTLASAHFSSQTGRTVFNDNTNPKCFLSNNQAGGIHIRNIGAAGGTTISFEVVINTYTLTASAGQGGTISPAGTTTLNQGDNQTYTFTPNASNNILAVLIDGVNSPSAVSAGSYTFNNVAANHTIEVQFGCPAQSLPIVETFAVFPPNCWINDSTTSHTWNRSASGTNPTISSPKTNSGMLRYNCRTFPSGSTGLLISPLLNVNRRDCQLIFWVYRDNAGSFGGAAYQDRLNIYLSATQSISGLTPICTIHRNNTLSPAETADGWYEYTVNLPTSTMNTAYVIFEGVSENGNNIFVDDIKIGTNVVKWNNYATGQHSAVFLATGGSIANDSIAVLTRDTAGTDFRANADNTAASASWQNATTTDKYWIANFSTRGFANLKLVSRQRGSDTGPQDFKIQYRIDTSALWTDVANGTIVVANDNYISGVNDNLPLPSAMDNQTEVSLRWLCTSTVSINGGTVGAQGVNRLEVAVFGEQMNSYIISASAGNNGTVTPLGDTTLYHGDSLTVNFTSNTGYHVDSVFVDNVYNATAVSAGSHTFRNIAANHTVRVTFAIDTFTITATSDVNGMITPNGTVAVTYGSNQTFNITPNIGYHIDSVFVDNIYSANAVAYAFHAFNTITENHSIHVTFAIDTFVITATCGINGTITPNGTITVNYGDSLTFNFMSDVGYHIDSVFVDNIYNEDAVTDVFYTFNPITENHSIHVTFAIDTFIITATNGINGTITPDGTITVNYGDSLTFNFMSDVGYHIDSVFIDDIYNEDAVTDGFYTFNPITENHSIHVTFAIDTFTITATSGINGTITPNGTITVNYGDSLTFNFTSDEGYHIDSVFIDSIYNEDAVADGFYTFSNITENHTIYATFAINTYIITATSGNGGKISPKGEITVNHGTDLTFIFDCVLGYSISELFVDNESVLDIHSSYTFYSITSNHTIHVEFIRGGGSVQTLRATSPLTIYPNPTDGQLTIEHRHLTTDNYSIFNTAGQTVMQGKLQCEDTVSTINIGLLANGMYYLRIDNRMLKIIKK